MEFVVPTGAVVAAGQAVQQAGNKEPTPEEKLAAARKEDKHAYLDDEGNIQSRDPFKQGKAPSSTAAEAAHGRTSPFRSAPRVRR